MFYEKCFITNVLWQMFYNKCFMTNVLWEMFYDKRTHYLLNSEEIFFWKAFLPTCLKEKIDWKIE
jgi:hypothetical protein